MEPDNQPITFERIRNALQPATTGSAPLSTVYMSVSLAPNVDLWERSTDTAPSTEERIVDMAQRFINALRAAEGRESVTLAVAVPS